VPAGRLLLPVDGARPRAGQAAVVTFPNELARSDLGCEWAAGDLCPICQADDRTGRLREAECPVCGGNWQGGDFDGGFYQIADCSRCDQGYVFVCDTCEWSS
jgi:hypothetical protein